MSILYHNTLTRRKEPVETVEPGIVRLYSCGPTVHDFAHIGNFRAFVFVDLLKRHLLLRGYEVRHVMNLTDVGHMTTDADDGEDKIGKSAREKGLDPWQVVEQFSQAFFEDIKTLRLLPAMVYPRATEHVPDMIRLVQRILDNGFAYEANGSVYYSLARFPAYGRLSGNTLGQLQEGARVEVNPEKHSPLDFALWKAAPNSFMRWESPWSVGVPGWHIECTAMAMRYLGEEIDIHTGGEDNIFPHHDCEIAQAHAATGRDPYVRLWMHNRHLRLAGGAKMSKSLGNFLTLRDLLAQGVKPTTLRYLLLSSHYRSNLTFSDEALDAAAKAVERLNAFVVRLGEAPDAAAAETAEAHLPRQMGNRPARDTSSDTGGSAAGPAVWPLCEKAKEDFAAALDDDLNISSALAVVFDFMHEINRLDLTAASAAPVRDVMSYFERVLGVLEEPEEVPDPEIERLIQERQAARKAKDYKKADAIRDALARRGIVLEDIPQGVRWRRAR